MNFKLRKEKKKIVASEITSLILGTEYTRVVACWLLSLSCLVSNFLLPVTNKTNLQRNHKIN